MFWVILVYFNIRNTLPKFCPFLLGHPVYIYKKYVICREVSQEKMVNSTCRSGKGNEEDFESEATISREKQLVPFSLYPCLFYHHNAVTSNR